MSCRSFSHSRLALLFLLYVTFVQSADTYDCESARDQYVGDAKGSLWTADWVNRGRCVRAGSDEQCYQTLNAILRGIVSIRAAEFQGAASVLALLPTIGSLMGTPTAEIWRLRNLFPLGGIFAVLLSLGAALVPTSVEDYEQTSSRENTAISKIFNARRMRKRRGGERCRNHVRMKLDKLEEEVREGVLDLHLCGDPDLPPKSPWFLNRTCFGVLGMALLFGMVQFGMTVVEQGAIIPWWWSGWWMHLWYLLVTLATVLESYAQYPFVRQRRITISNFNPAFRPEFGRQLKLLKGGEYELSIYGARDEDPCHGKESNDLVTTVKPVENQEAYPILKQLEEPPPSSACSNINDAAQPTKHGHSLTILLSFLSDHETDLITQLRRATSKTINIGVYVFSTAMFASVTLLSLEASLMILGVVGMACILGRSLAGFIVHRLSKDEPVIHFIVPEREENLTLTRLLRLSGSADLQAEVHGKPIVNGDHVSNVPVIQAEIDGNIIINERHVFSRPRHHVLTQRFFANPHWPYLYSRSYSKSGQRVAKEMGPSTSLSATSLLKTQIPPPTLTDLGMNAPLSASLTSSASNRRLSWDQSTTAQARPQALTALPALVNKDAWSQV